MRGGVFEGQLGCELAVHSARKVDSTLRLINIFKSFMIGLTDLSLAFETMSSILSATSTLAAVSALSGYCGAAM